MLTFSNSGLFYRFLTLLPSQREPNSVCDLFWRMILNTLIIVAGLLLVTFYLYGVYGWFAGFLEGKVRVEMFASVMAFSLTAACIGLFGLNRWEKHKEATMMAWRKANGASYWEWIDYKNEQRKVRKNRLKPFLKKIVYGLEVTADILGGLYKRVHDKTCVMVEFTDKNEPEAPEPFVIDIEDDEPDPVDKQG